MTTEYLHEFLILSRAGNYNKAAEALFISQSVLTRHIQKLESELGTQLFTRSGRENVLTDGGKMLLLQLPALLEACDSATNRIHLSGLPARGTLKIFCSLEISYANHIKNFVAGFMRRYKDIDLVLKVLPVSLGPELLWDCDVILSPCMYEDIPESRRHLLYRHSIYAYFPPGHRFLSRQNLNLEELAGETVIVPYADEVFGPYAQNWRLLERTVHGRITCIPAENQSTAVFLLSTGLGGILLGPRYVRSMLPANIFSASMVVNISDDRLCFPEYLYEVNSDNPLTNLFCTELREACTGGQE